MTERRRTRFDEMFEAHFRPVLAYALRRVDEPADAMGTGADVPAGTPGVGVAESYRDSLGCDAP